MPAALKTTARVLEIDFLRGLAILLVVAFHYPSVPYLNDIGYIGVDLFFVLSGYLISSLLFKEYIRFGNVHSKLFLIRRGFKIYPLFYFFILLTVSFKLFYQEPIHPVFLAGELSFTRNYLGGLWAHTWSICVEEHFYFSIALIMWYVKKDELLNIKKMNTLFVCLALFSMSLEMLNVFIENRTGESYFFNGWARRVQTQYCFDSLLYGVFLAYNLLFNKEAIESLFRKYWPLLTLISLVIIAAVPLIKIEYFRPFRDTLLYLAFGNILLLFLTNVLDFERIKNSMLKLPLRIIAAVGVYSYSIYLFHLFIIDYVMHKYHVMEQTGYSFFVYLGLSVAAGVVFSKAIELPLLRLRDKYFPARK